MASLLKTNQSCVVFRFPEPGISDTSTVTVCVRSLFGDQDNPLQGPCIAVPWTLESNTQICVDLPPNIIGLRRQVVVTVDGTVFNSPVFP